MSKGFSEKINKNICMRRRWSGCRRGRGGVGHSSCRLHCVLLQSPLLFETFSVLSYTRNNHGSSHKPTQAAPQTAGWKSDSVPERLNPNKLCSLSLSLSLSLSRVKKVENVFLFSWNIPLRDHIYPRVTLGGAVPRCCTPPPSTSQVHETQTLAGIRETQKPPKCSCRVAPLRGTTTLRGLIFHPKMFLMSCGVLNVKVYIYVVRSLLDYHGNWGSMLEVSGRQRDLDEPCECGGRDGERERERDREWQRKWKQMERKVRNKSFNGEVSVLRFSLFICSRLREERTALLLTF